MGSGVASLKKVGGSKIIFVYEVFVTNNSLRKLIIMKSVFIKCSVGKNKIL